MVNPMVVDAVGRHTATIIFSHGLGDSALGWAPLARSLSRRPSLSHIKWVLPTAEKQPVTLNGGMKMNSWFDILSLSPSSPTSPQREDEAGMLRSVAVLQKLVQQEVDAGIPAKRVVVGGFSQGAVISLLLGALSPSPLGGLISLSGFLGLAPKLAQFTNEQGREHVKMTRVFWGHGTGDEVVRYSWGQLSVAALQAAGWQGVEFHTYPGMPHSFCAEEEVDLVRWVEGVLPSEFGPE